MHAAWGASTYMSLSADTCHESRALRNSPGPICYLSRRGFANLSFVTRYSSINHRHLIRGVLVLPEKYRCEEAANNGDLVLLQWVRAHGCPWDGWTCYWAAVNGHLHVLQWARGEGCPWDKDFCERVARENKHFDVAEWIKSSWSLRRALTRLCCAFGRSVSRPPRPCVKYLGMFVVSRGAFTAVLSPRAML